MRPSSGALVLVLLAGCGDNLPAAGDGGGESDPFAAQPDTSEGLINLSADLDQLLESGALDGACERYLAAGASASRRERLLCGKWMFFYESFDTAGVPAVLVDHLAADYPAEVGAGFEHLGMVADPGSPVGRPLGMAPSLPLGDYGEVPTYAFTCASCHFARLPDGRYAVGAPNHAYDYGGQVLGLGLYPLVALGVGGDEHAPEALAVIEPLLARFEADEGVRDRLTQASLTLAGLGTDAAIAWTPELERAYATWLTGTQDFLIAPLPLDDDVHTISKIIDLWGIPTADEENEAGMIHAMLAWSGGAPSLTDFVEGFALIGGQTAWSREEVLPLVEYIESLRPPDNPEPPDPALAREGERLFRERGCADCHGAPRGGGTALFDYAEIGTDDAMARWMDADGDGEPCCGADLEAELTGKLKSPRLTGMWAKRRFLHNGSVESLEDLFCASGPRGSIDEPAYGDAGHDFTCSLPESERRALIAYLLEH